MKYKTKPFEIEAVQYFQEINQQEVFEFTNGNFNDSEEVYDYLQDTWVSVNEGDYIIKGMKGEYYPCDAEVFEAKYDRLD